MFETALNRNAVAVRRTPADRANSQAMDDFTSLKHKGQGRYYKCELLSQICLKSKCM